MVGNDHARAPPSWLFQAMSRAPAGPTVLSMTETFDIIVIGGGQAGLSVGYYLKKQGRQFVILDANERIGGSWRRDSIWGRGS